MSYADVLSLFPLPVFSSVLEDVDGEKIYKNLELEKFNETSQAQSQEDSTNSYITEDLYLLEKYSELKNSIEKNLEAYVKKVLTHSKATFKITTSWATLTPHGGSGQIHKHCNSWISGVYYPHATDGICFHRPLTSNWSLETDEWNAFNSDIWKVEPVPNTLLIFPSLLQHSILKNKSDKNRYSIAFNVLPTGRFGQGDSTIYISAK